MLKDRENKGITLVALVVTIVILLILAGISISALTNTGIFQKAKDAKGASENAEKEQKQTLSEYEKELNKYTAQELTDDKINKVLSETENIVLKDANGNIFTLPAGFKVVVNDDTGNAKTVDKGIVIEDETDVATKGSQFVWVPVGKIYTDVERMEENAKTISLGRYDFDTKTGAESEYTGGNVEEDKGDTNTALKKWGNTIAKSISEFKTSVTINGGYYIGRYEARTTVERKSKDDDLTQITEKGTDIIYNYMTQSNAALKAQTMYDNTNFISDLINSYAWDTAISFIQKCTEQTNYANQISFNKALLPKGTTTDKQCNIYDMASNIFEWTTETSIKIKYPNVLRGGCYANDAYHTDNRLTDNTIDSFIYGGFRPILYINN